MHGHRLLLDKTDMPCVEQATKMTVCAAKWYEAHAHISFWPSDGLMIDVEPTAAQSMVQK